MNKLLPFMRLFLFCIFFVSLFPVKAQESTDSEKLIEINNLLHFYDFEQIRSFILKNGDRKTYCPNYTDNPHYEIEDKKLEIYMNPSVSGDYKPRDLDYTIMYIVSKDEKLPFNYYLYLTDRRDVYLYDYNQYLSDEVVRKKVLSELSSILSGIKSVMDI